MRLHVQSVMAREELIESAVSCKSAVLPLHVAIVIPADALLVNS